MHRERSNEVCNSKLDESDSKLGTIRTPTRTRSRSCYLNLNWGILSHAFFNSKYFKLTQCASLTTLCSTLFPETHPDNFS